MNALKTIHTELLREGVHIVPDIETLSTAPNAMILSIGAVAVVNGKIVGEVDIEKCKNELYRTIEAIIDNGNSIKILFASPADVCPYLKYPTVRKKVINRMELIMSGYGIECLILW